MSAKCRFCGKRAAIETRVKGHTRANTAPIVAIGSDGFLRK